MLLVQSNLPIALLVVIKKEQLHILGLGNIINPLQKMDTEILSTIPTVRIHVLLQRKIVQINSMSGW